MYKVFVSHCIASENLPLLNQLRSLLEERHIDCYVANRNDESGNLLSPEDEQAIKNCDCFVAVWTARGRAPSFIKQEISWAKSCGKIRFILVEKSIFEAGIDEDKECIPLDPTDPSITLKLLADRLDELKTEPEGVNAGVLIALLGVVLLLTSSES